MNTIRSASALSTPRFGVEVPPSGGKDRDANPIHEPVPKPRGPWKWIAPCRHPMRNAFCAAMTQPQTESQLDSLRSETRAAQSKETKLASRRDQPVDPGLDSRGLLFHKPQ